LVFDGVLELLDVEDRTGACGRGISRSSSEVDRSTGGIGCDCDDRRSPAGLGAGDGDVGRGTVGYVDATGVRDRSIEAAADEDETVPDDPDVARCPETEDDRWWLDEIDAVLVVAYRGDEIYPGDIWGELSGDVAGVAFALVGILGGSGTK
jgi:hypothetical protein